MFDQPSPGFGFMQEAEMVTCSPCVPAGVSYIAECHGLMHACMHRNGKHWAPTTGSSSHTWLTSSIGQVPCLSTDRNM